MGKYDNVTAKELHDKKMEMLNSLGRTELTCTGVKSDECPLNIDEFCSCDELEAEHFDEYVKIIMEYEPKVDWENVEVDTKIMVRNESSYGWFPRYFAKYENGKVYTWHNGATKFSANNFLVAWEKAKLYKE